MNPFKVLIIFTICIFTNSCGEPEKTSVKTWEVKHFSDGSEQNLKTKWENGYITYIFTSNSDLHKKIIDENKKSRAMLGTQMKFYDKDGFTLISHSSFVSMFTVKGNLNILEGMSQCSYDDYQDLVSWELNFN